jgi:hypothetical protein
MTLVNTCQICARKRGYIPAPEEERIFCLFANGYPKKEHTCQWFKSMAKKEDVPLVHAVVAEPSGIKFTVCGKHIKGTPVTAGKDEEINCPKCKKQLIAEDWMDEQE